MAEHEKYIRQKARALDFQPEIPPHLRLPEEFIKKMNKQRSKTQVFYPNNLIRLEDAPAMLTTDLNVEHGFTLSKIEKITNNLDPRIIIEVEGEHFVNRSLLHKRLVQYLEQLPKDKVLRSTRSSRTNRRRNVALRELLMGFEGILKNSSDMQENLVQAINRAFGDEYKHMSKEEFLPFVESFRINADKRRIRAEEAEYELLALEELSS